jgi:hypothetical protein
MEAICSYETSVDIQRTTRRYIPEDGTLYNHRCENLKSYNEYFDIFNKIVILRIVKMSCDIWRKYVFGFIWACSIVPD